jgi:hypothetical protein
MKFGSGTSTVPQAHAHPSFKLSGSGFEPMLCSVCLSVPPEVTGFRSTVHTALMQTGKWLLARMGPSVNLEVTGTRSAVSTALSLAGKWLFARVSSSVLRKVTGT